MKRVGHDPAALGSWPALTVEEIRKLVRARQAWEMAKLEATVRFWDLATGPPIGRQRWITKWTLPALTSAGRHRVGTADRPLTA